MDIKYNRIRTKYDIVIAGIFTIAWLLLYFSITDYLAKPIILKICVALSVSMLIATIVKTNIPMKQYIPINNLLALIILFLITILSVVTTAFIGSKLNIYVDNQIKQDPIYTEIPKMIGAGDLNKELWWLPTTYLEQISQVDAGYETYNFIRGAVSKLNSGTESEYENYMDEKVVRIQSQNQTYFINEIIKKSGIGISFLGLKVLAANTLTSIILTIIGLIWLIEDIFLIKMNLRIALYVY